MMSNWALLLIKVIKVIVIKVIDDNDLEDEQLSIIDADALAPPGCYYWPDLDDNDLDDEQLSFVAHKGHQGHCH